MPSPARSLWLCRRTLAESLPAVAVALVATLGTVFVACSDADPDGPAQLEERDGGSPGAEGPSAAPGADPGAPGTSDPGPGTGGAAARPVDGGGPPWLQPSGDCPPSETTIYVTGLLLDMTTGEATCERKVLVCGDTVTSKRRYNSNTESCPWSTGGRVAIFFSEPGPLVCCGDWEAAKHSKTPCDPQADADCDGIPNEQDLESLIPAAPAG